MTAFPDGPVASNAEAGSGRSYRVTHRTEYKYSDVVTSSYGRGFLTPRDSARQQQCREVRARNEDHDDDGDAHDCERLDQFRALFPQALPAGVDEHAKRLAGPGPGPRGIDRRADCPFRYDERSAKDQYRADFLHLFSLRSRRRCNAR